jgi:hypothetical protein
VAIARISLVAGTLQWGIAAMEKVGMRRTAGSSDGRPGDSPVPSNDMTSFASRSPDERRREEEEEGIVSK